MTQASEGVERHDAVVVGAGITGLYALHKLRDELATPDSSSAEG